MTWNTRPEVNSIYNTRPPLQSDLWYLITQLWILCDNSWNRIRFHTWTFYEAPSVYNWRPVVSNTWNIR